MKIEKLYEELKRCDLEITKLEQKKTQIKDKIKIEEQRLLEKRMKERNLSFEDLLKLIDQCML